MSTVETVLPDFQEWSIAAVRLLQGAVYVDDRPEWEIVLSRRTTLERYVGHLGLILVVDETDGLAFLRQAEEDELSVGYDRLPRLFRKSRLGYEDTLLCVLLRDEMRRFDEEELDHERCVVATATLFEKWRVFFASDRDEVRLKRSLDATLHRLDDLRFVRQIGRDPEEWEVRPILKARLPLVKLESLREMMQFAQKSRLAPEGPEPSHV